MLLFVGSEPTFRGRKMKKRILAATLLALVSALALAGADDWSPLANMVKSDVDVRRDSMRFFQADGGKWIASMTVRWHTKSNDRYDFNHMAVQEYDCRRGFGTIITLDLNGNFLFENNFVDGGDNMASAAADLLCFGLGRHLGEKAKKPAAPKNQQSAPMKKYL